MKHFLFKRIENITLVTSILLFVVTMIYSFHQVNELLKVRNNLESMLPRKMKIIGFWGTGYKSNFLGLDGHFLNPDSLQNVYKITVGERSRNGLKLYDNSYTKKVGDTIDVWYVPTTNFIYLKFHSSKENFYLFYEKKLINEMVILFLSLVFSIILFFGFKFLNKE